MDVVKECSSIALGTKDDRPDYDYADGGELLALETIFVTNCRRGCRILAAAPLLFLIHILSYDYLFSFKYNSARLSIASITASKFLTPEK